MSKDKFTPDGKWGSIQYTNEQEPLKEDIIDEVRILIEEKETMIKNKAPQEELFKKEKQIWDTIYKKRFKSMLS